MRDIDDILECLASPPVASLPTAKEWCDARLSHGTEKEIEASRTRILAALGAEATDIDEIIRWCDEPVSTVLVAILELELAGRISRHHGNRICRIADAGTSD